jgi:hypothetical protein
LGLTAIIAIAPEKKQEIIMMVNGRLRFKLLMKWSSATLDTNPITAMNNEINMVLIPMSTLAFWSAIPILRN